VGRHHFIAKMPNEPGALHRAAEIIKRRGGNIDRIQYDRRIDPNVVFFEVRCEDDEFLLIKDELRQIGFLQTSLAAPPFLKFHVYLPNRAGALFELLNFTTASKANIAFLDFDDKGQYPERLTVSLTAEDEGRIQWLLDELKSRYRLEIVDQDLSGRRLDDTLFYLRFAQELRPYIGPKEEDFLMRLLGEINHTVQELERLGMDPHKVFDSWLEIARTLQASVGPGFASDVQRFELDGAELHCFQMPCGGSVYTLRSGEEMLMIDSAYGIYHADLAAMLDWHGLGDAGRRGRIMVTHADVDHSGGAGGFEAPAILHPETLEILRTNNRALGSKMEGSVLEAVYTKMIDLFSKAIPLSEVDVLDTAGMGEVHGLRALRRLSVGKVEMIILEGLGGHLRGQIFAFSPTHHLLFTGDSLINFASLSPERERYASLAKDLMTTVNVDSDKASAERKALQALAKELDIEARAKGRRCLVCCGHGAVSILKDGKLDACGEMHSYRQGMVHGEGEEK
jgi:glyoxylase-like metal-dependent hydrolase (beta-lactamase superfamily II)